MERSRLDKQGNNLTATYRNLAQFTGKEIQDFYQRMTKQVNEALLKVDQGKDVPEIAALHRDFIIEIDQQSIIAFRSFVQAIESADPSGMCLFQETRDPKMIESRMRILIDCCSKEGVVNVCRENTELIYHCQELAEKGVPFAQGCIGYCLEFGLIVPLNHTRAFAWYKKGADQKDPFSQYRLGMCYERGNIIPRDKAKAVSCFELAAAQGQLEAQDLLRDVT